MDNMQSGVDEIPRIIRRLFLQSGMDEIQRVMLPAIHRGMGMVHLDLVLAIIGPSEEHSSSINPNNSFLPVWIWTE